MASTKIRKMSTAQIKTLGTLIAQGGEMNGYAGQKGFYCNSMGPLVKLGYLTEPRWCDGSHGEYTTWDATDGEITHPSEPCTLEHTELVGQKGGKACYNRVSITDAGRAAYAVAVATPVSEVVESTSVAVEIEPVEVEAPVEAPVVVQGTRVRSVEGVRGQVLEVGMRAGVGVAAVAFGMLLVWVKVAELVAA